MLIILRQLNANLALLVKDSLNLIVLRENQQKSWQTLLLALSHQQNLILCLGINLVLSIICFGFAQVLMNWWWFLLGVVLFFVVIALLTYWYYLHQQIKCLKKWQARLQVKIDKQEQEPVLMLLQQLGWVIWHYLKIKFNLPLA